MSGSAGRLAGVASIVLLVATPFLMHRFAFGAASPWLIGGLAACQVAATASLIGRRWSQAWRIGLPLAALGAIAATMLLTGLPARQVGLAVTGGAHALAYSAMLTWFGASLRAGHEPVITGFARRLRRKMPPKVIRYTRRVTIAWCAFFAAQLAVSAALLWAAPAAVWSGFVSVLNLPLLAAMMLGEFACRQVLFRHEPRTSLTDTLLALRTMRGGQA